MTTDGIVCFDSPSSVLGEMTISSDMLAWLEYHSESVICLALNPFSLRLECVRLREEKERSWQICCYCIPVDRGRDDDDGAV